MSCAATTEYDDVSFPAPYRGLVEQEPTLAEFEVKTQETDRAAASPVTRSTQENDMPAAALAGAAEILELSLSSDSPEETEQLEAEVFSLLSPHPAKALAILALDNRLPSDTRGVAARLFSENIRLDSAPPDMHRLAVALKSSGQALVRLGFLLGLEEGTSEEILADLCQDSHPRVRYEARKLTGCAR